MTNGVVALLNSHQAAKLLNISTRKLWTLTNCGQIPAVRMGRAVRYDPADLQRFIDQSKKR